MSKELLKIETEIEELERIAKNVRKNVLSMIFTSKASHLGCALSITDILVALYFKILNVNPNNFKDKNRDKFILSKGHASSALYAVLSEKGFFPKERLMKFCSNGEFLTGHVNSEVPGIEVDTGSLGHGLPIGVGMALANKLDNNPGKIFVLIGDGECNEGSIFEAAISASRFNLDNLITIVDYNNLQGLDRCEDIYPKSKMIDIWKGAGWEVIEVNGHDLTELISSLKNIPVKKNKPTLIFANTIKGKGVSFMEDKLEWHYKTPTEEQLKIAFEELK